MEILKFKIDGTFWMCLNLAKIGLSIINRALAAVLNIKTYQSGIIFNKLMQAFLSDKGFRVYVKIYISIPALVHCSLEN